MRYLPKKKEKNGQLEHNTLCRLHHLDLNYEEGLKCIHQN